MSSDDDFISRTAGKPELAGRTASGGFRADRLLSAQDLGALSARRDSKGWGQLFGHLAVLG